MALTGIAGPQVWLWTYADGVETLGDRLARIRRRQGYTQEGLAEASGVSVGTLRKLERNDRESARLSTLHKLARALGVTTTDLLGTHIPAAPVGPSSEDPGLLAIRKALTPVRVGAPDPVEGAPATADELNQSVKVGIRWYRSDDYTAAVRVVPGLLLDAETAVAEASEADRPELLRRQAAALNLTGSLLIHLRHFDLAYEALRQGRAAAAACGDGLADAALVDTLCWMLIRQNRFDEMERAAVAAADVVEPAFSTASRAHLAQWGWLMVRASTAAARNTRYSEAEEYMRLAGAAAAGTGDIRFRWQNFGPSMVAMKSVENEMVRHRPDRAIALAEHVVNPGTKTNNNRNRHLLDVAAARMELRQFAAAGSTLQQIRADAPDWLRLQPYASQIVSDLIERRARALPEDLVDHADFFGLD
jgi:transcriptional regulator with XRE-family HTH domain